MIKNIIFDLGNVLVGVEPERFKKGLLSEGITRKKYEYFGNKWREHNSIHQFETGRMTTADFINFSLRNLDGELTGEKLVRYFNDMLVASEEMKNFLENFSSTNNYRLFLLSNTNPIHWKFVKRNFKYVSLIENCGLSYRLRLYKPDPRIYLKLIKSYKLNPGESLFIDDSKENCKSARSVGLRTITFSSYGSFIRKFRKLIEF